MNLRWFHALLILLSAALAVVFGVWLFRQGNGVASQLGAGAAFAVAIALVLYDSWFLRKTRTLR
jgi:glycerol-3-phosphate acyltransferase PlsY